MTPAAKKSSAKKAAPKKAAAKMKKVAPKKVVRPSVGAPVGASHRDAQKGPQKGVPLTEKTKPAPTPKKEPARPPSQPRIRIRLSAFDHTVIDEAAMKIIETAERSGAVVHGPIPLPTHIRKFTVNRSTFVKKDARDQFEMRTHRRLIDLTETTFKTVESLQSLSLPSGVDIEIKMG